MELFIDPRAGSKKLLEKFPGECQEQMLEAGDIAFFGNGPNNNVYYIGIEYKNLEDICACIKTGRFTGQQLPLMMRLYDVSFLLIEGIGLLDYRTGQFSKRLGKMTYGFGLPYKAYENFLTSVAVHSALAGKPCIVKRATNLQETVHIIADIYSWFQKPWEEHSSIHRPSSVKSDRIAYEMELVRVEPGDIEYPRHVLRKALFQIDRLGWDLAGKIADRFVTMESLMAATQAEIVGDKVGPVLAARIYDTFHGHPDPTIPPKKFRKKKAPAEELVDIGVNL